MKILVLEQNRNMMELLIDILSLQGHEVFDADTPEHAIQLFKDNNQDLIIIDSEFGSSNEIIKNIRAMSNDVQVVVLTTVGSYVFIDTVKQYNIAEFIPKDTSTELLLGIIIKFIKKMD